MTDDINQVDEPNNTPLLQAAAQPDGEETALALLKAGADPNHVDENGFSTLYWALFSGHNALVTELVKRGVAINQGDSYGRTPLMIAATSSGKEKMALALLNAGADPGKVNENGDSALHYACRCENDALVTELIKRGVNVDQANSASKTPLIVAVDSSAGEQMALALLKAGADPGKIDEDGRSTLHYACRCGHKGLVTELIKRGVDVNQGDSYGRTPIMVAMDYCDGEEVALQLLNAGADPGKVDKEGDSVLHYACRCGHDALVTELIERGVNVDQAGSASKTPLIVAADSSAGEQMALALLKAGADPGKIDEDGGSALHYACRCGHKGLVIELIERGVDVDVAARRGITPLMMTAGSSNGEAAALTLLKAGADPRKVDEDGNSALHYACRFGRKALVTDLIKRGVDVDLANRKGRTPLMTTAGSPNGEATARTLLKAGADPSKVDEDGNSALHYACDCADKSLVIDLIERGVDVDLADRKGRTPFIVTMESLMLAWLTPGGGTSLAAVNSSGGGEVALDLLKAGADPGKVDEDGESALHYACRCGHKALVTELIERGVDVNLADRTGRTPLMVAADSSSGEEVALMLLEAGADPTKTDNQGQSAAHFAEKEGHTKLLQALTK